ncbi:PA14 domain-containing protein [Solirubrobacter pauli]|uniref:PA14 domain-containing protein n=1 Tax=Solirubrobacter pauli TaxID=166793 RepID=A0A660LH69_9ACTN|nr:family 16 glycoside hydrolase [Solirubrobacter pauli]RKQ92121.1 PA14 domain-containing protein [Solirubrobacter pauli]
MSASWRTRAGIAAAAVTGALGALAGSAAAQNLPPQEPGVTMRTYQFAVAPNGTCTLKARQTPNVDKLMPTINWTQTSEFGLEGNFQTEVLANLNIATAGDYAFRLTSDDGSVLWLDGKEVVNNDGMHAVESKEGTATLTAGNHTLLIKHVDGANEQVLKLEWKTPGSSAYAVVPSTVLSTEAQVVRVTAPGSKFCEGDTDTPGDGLPLESVNPDYDLTDIRPSAFQPKVSGMDFLPDGRMVITTTGDVSSGGWVPNPESSEVYVLDHVTGNTSKDQVTYTKVADKLKNAMGIQVIDGRWYVSEREGLTELLPDGDDADTMMDHKRLASWPNGGNFHEFAFGLIHDADYFYIARSNAINNGGATTDPQPGKDPGTAIKIDRKTWEVSTIAGGLRTPNGIGFGPEGGIFVNDNQGAWLPSNKMVQIKPGRFFNHYTNPPGPYDDKPVTQPVLWMPQNEVANSPSNPVMLTDGPFKGQMIWGDVTYGGLQRGFLEKVGGEFQGAVFRHTAGLEVGVNRTMIGPDGAIYVGGTGEGGNWGQEGKQRYGLQKLTPSGKNVFDMEKMEVVEGGFKISYTQPLSDETAAKAKSAYQFKQWRYVPTAQYGGPKVDEEGLLVTDATVAADKKSVTIKVDGLKPGRVVYVRSPAPFSSAAGEALWNSEAWYTLNSLPGYTATPTQTGNYEAEEAVLRSGASVETEHSGYSGSGFAGGFFNNGANLTWQVDVDADGTYPVNIRYANGPNPSTKDKSLALYVNGVKQDNWVFPTTSTADWKAWAFSTKSLALKKGTNQIKLSFDSGTDGNVNFDTLKIGEAKDICAPATLEPGYVGLFDGTLDSLAKWRMAGPGSFGRQTDCSIKSVGGLGLNWYTPKSFTNYSLKLDWKMTNDSNGGVFVGFPDPKGDPWTAVDNGYEIQIDETDDLVHLTGSIYGIQGADRDKVLASLKPLGQWNAYELLVQGNNIKIILNGTVVNDYTVTNAARDLAGFVGLQNHGDGDNVWYRNVRIKEGLIDNVAPTVTGTLDPAAPDADGSYKRPVTLTLAGQDDKPGTVTLEYRVNGGAWTAYTSPVTVSAQGEHVIEYRATDAAGNVSAIGSKTVKITATTSNTDHELIGNVPATLAITLGAQSSLGNFEPGATRDYTASTLASVTSTAGDAALSVVDPSTTNTGKLVNGAYALAQPLQVKAGGAFAALSGTPLTLKTFSDPVSGADVAIDFKQSINEKDALRTGRYSKTLTFTLSTITP